MWFLPTQLVLWGGMSHTTSDVLVDWTTYYALYIPAGYTPDLHDYWMILTGVNYLSRKPNLRANIEIYSFLALEELFQFLGIKRCLIAIYCFSRFGILNISGQMLYGADSSLTSEWFACLKTEHDYGKVFKLINFGITAYTRVILMMMLQSQHFRLLDSTFHNITHKA